MLVPLRMSLVSVRLVSCLKTKEYGMLIRCVAVSLYLYHLESYNRFHKLCYLCAKILLTYANEISIHRAI